MKSFKCISLLAQITHVVVGHFIEFAYMVHGENNIKIYYPRYHILQIARGGKVSWLQN